MTTKHNVYRLIRYFFILLSIMSLFHRKALAVPACDKVFVITQPFGHSFEARQKGDERHNWMETKDGYGIYMNHNTGNCEFLLPDDEKNTNGAPFSKKSIPGAVVGVVDPSTLGISKGIRPPRKKTSEISVGITGPNNSYSEESATGSNNTSIPLSSGSQVSGTKNLLVIGVEFSDQAANYPPNDIQPLFFGPSGSLADYFSEVSYGNVSISPATESQGTADDGFIGWLQLNYDHPNPVITGVENQQIARDAIEAADQFIDYSQYDTDGDGTIQTTELSIIIIVAGYEASISGTLTPSVWGHKWSIGTVVGFPSVDGKTIKEYAQFGEKHVDHLATIGIMCHEVGHLMFSLPDLYDTNGGSGGIGAFGLMGSGSWGMDTGSYPGSSPTHLCAWSKKTLGWGTVTTIPSIQQISFPKADGNSASIFRINTMDPKQYFLVENRQFSGYDSGFKKWSGSVHGGLAIYHIDESKIGNADEDNKQVDVEEANEGSLGYSMLDTTSIRAHTNMFYFAGNNSTFSGSTVPDSNLNDGTATNVTIMNISNYGDIMVADVQVDLVADFMADNICGTIPFTVNFTNLSDANGPGYTYLWDFGDGNTSTTENPSHTYTIDGIYTVSLAVQDVYGSDTKTIFGYIKTRSQYSTLDSSDPGGPAFNWIEINNTGTALNLRDDDSALVPLPFSFEFYGTNYNQVYVNSNGSLNLNFFSGYSNTCLPTAVTSDIIAVYWDDLNPSVSGEVYYKTMGTSPNRTFVIEWFNVSHHYYPNGNITFEIILHEESNKIIFQYLDVGFGDPIFDNGNLATTGIQNNSNVCDSTPYSCNEAVLSDQLAIQFAIDIEVDFTAPAGGDGSPVNPFNNLPDAITAVDIGGTINIKSGSTSGPLTITKSMIMKSSDGGTVIVGP